MKNTQICFILANIWLMLGWYSGVRTEISIFNFTIDSLGVKIAWFLFFICFVMTFPSLKESIKVFFQRLMGLIRVLTRLVREMGEFMSFLWKDR